MNSNEIIEYKESFITKIKNFFKKLFMKNEEKVDNTPVVSNIDVDKEEKTEEFINELKVEAVEVEKIEEVNKKIKRDKFIKEVEEDENILNLLSIDRLKKLNEYYDEIIKENEEKIYRLKKSA